MPSVLSDRKICHPYVPLQWQPVLERLARFLALERQLRATPDDADLIGEIANVHQQLISGSNQLLEPSAVDDLSERELHRLFARSVFFVMRIACAVAGDGKVLDTAGCRTLHLYEADFLAAPGNQRRMRTALEKTLCLSRDELNEIESLVVRDTGAAETKHKIAAAIRDHFGLWEDAADLRRNAFRFFEAIYPDVGILADEVELIVTGTMIFFCLPFSGDELTTERFARLSSEQRDKIRKFLRRVNRFAQWQFAHFPVFGFRRGADLDSQLIGELAARSQLPTDVVAREFSTMTAVVPISELDKYVVHDIWGHSWQACMLGFDRSYEQLATYADPLQLGEQATAFTGSQTVRFVDCFSFKGAEVSLDEVAFRRFVNLEVAERLPFAMTPVLAELLADVAEYKLLDMRVTRVIPSSSALKSFPAKLDLTMRDVIYYFRQATKVFRLWAKREDRLQRTVEQLMARGATPNSAKSAVERAAHIWRELERDWLSPELQFRADDGQLRVNVVCRLALNFLAIHRETLNVYQRIGSMALGDLPLKGLRDLMLISVAVFFDHAPGTNLWRVDEFVTLKMEPLCEALTDNA